MILRVLEIVGQKCVPSGHCGLFVEGGATFLNSQSVDLCRLDDYVFPVALALRSHANGRPTYNWSCFVR